MKEQGPGSECLGPAPASNYREPGVDTKQMYYEIRASGQLDDRWAAWFDGLSLARMEDGTTILSGPVADQAALRGMLNRLWDLNLSVISVRRIEREEQGG